MKVRELNTKNYIGIRVIIPDNFVSTPQISGDRTIYKNKYPKIINGEMYVSAFWAAVITSGVWLKKELSDKLSYPLTISPEEFFELDVVEEKQ